MAHILRSSDSTSRRHVFDEHGILIAIPASVLLWTLIYLAFRLAIG